MMMKRKMCVFAFIVLFVAVPSSAASPYSPSSLPSGNNTLFGDIPEVVVYTREDNKITVLGTSLWYKSVIEVAREFRHEIIFSFSTKEMLKKIRPVDPTPYYDPIVIAYIARKELVMTIPFSHENLAKYIEECLDYAKWMQEEKISQEEDALPSMKRRADDAELRYMKPVPVSSFSVVALTDPLTTAIKSEQPILHFCGLTEQCECPKQFPPATFKPRFVVYPVCFSQDTVKREVAEMPHYWLFIPLLVILVGIFFCFYCCVDCNQMFATDGTRDNADDDEEEEEVQRGERDEDDDSRSSAANSGQEDTTSLGCQKMEKDEEEEVEDDEQESSFRPSSVKRMRLEEARGDLDQEMEESVENQADSSFTMTPAIAPRPTAVRRFRGSSKQLGIPAKMEEEEQRVVLKMDEEEEERTEEEIEEDEEEEEERHDQTFATDGTREDAGDGDADDEEEEEKQKKRGERDTEDDDSRSSAANSGQEEETTSLGCQKMENDGEEEDEQEEMERESDGESPQEFLETDDIDEEEEEEEDVEKCGGDEEASEFVVRIDEDFEGEENQPTPSTFEDLRKLRIEGGSYDPIKRMESFRGMAQRLENCVELGSQEPSQLTNRCEGLGKAHEVWNLLCRKDSMYSILDVHFMDGLGPKFAERTILVDWMMEVCAGENLHRETFHLAVDYIDRFISNMRKLSLPVSVGEFQLIGTTAIHIAAKYEEIYPPKLDEIVTYTDGACTEEQVRRLELVLLKVLEWELNVVTSLHWLHIFLQLLGGTTDGNSELLVSEDGDQSGHFTEGTMPVTVPACLRSEFVHMAQVLDICLMFGECRAFSNRQLAAAILFLCVEPASLVEHITGITLHEAGPAMEFAREIEEWCTERRPAGDPLPYIEGVRPDDVHNIQRYHSAEIEELKKSLAQRRHARAVKREQRRQAVGTTKQVTTAAPVSGRPKSRPPIREIRLQATSD